MNPIKRILNALKPRPVLVSYDQGDTPELFEAVKRMNEDAIAEALNVSDTPYGGWVPSGMIETHNGPMRIVEPPASLLDRHAAIATEAIDKFAADEQRLLETIRAAETDHATHIAGLRQQLADTRTALRFYKTGPDMLKRRAERPAAPVKAKRKPRKASKVVGVTKAPRANGFGAVKVNAPTAPRTLKEAQSVGRSLRKVKAVPAVFDISKPPIPAVPANVTIIDQGKVKEV